MLSRAAAPDGKHPVRMNRLPTYIPLLAFQNKCCGSVVEPSTGPSFRPESNPSPWAQAQPTAQPDMVLIFLAHDPAQKSDKKSILFKVHSLMRAAYSAQKQVSAYK